MILVRSKIRTIAGFLVLVVACVPLSADELPGMGHLSGSVKGVPAGLLATVMARNIDNDVGFMVYFVDGKYRAANLFPGECAVSVRPAVDQVFADGFEIQTKRMDLEDGQEVTLDFTLTPRKYQPDYAGGMTHKGGWADAVRGLAFPPPSTDTKVFPYNYHRRYASGRRLYNKPGWSITVDRMSKAVAFGRPNKQPYFDRSLL